MTIEESWKSIKEEMHLPDSALFRAVHDATWKAASENQQKIDIEKAWEWFDKNIGKVANTSPFGVVIMLDRFNIYKEKFKKAMEEQKCH